MNNSVFKDIKTQLEMINITIIDEKLLSLSNLYINYLKNNAVPIEPITKQTTVDEFTSNLKDKDGDYSLILNYIYNKVVIALNQEDMGMTSYEILSEIVRDHLWMLKSRYHL